MLLTLEPLQALEGDCLLLHWGTESAPKIAVIDGGPSNVYADSLRPRLDKLRDARNINQLLIDLVMVSHVDNDHIVGVKKFFRDLKNDLQNFPKEKRPYKVNRLWHNTFNDILGDGIDKYYKTLTASLQATIGASEVNPVLVAGLANAIRQNQPAVPDADEQAYDIANVLAGHGEGRELRDIYEYLHDNGEIYTLNTPFNKNGHATLITLEMTPSPKEINGLFFKIIGPMQNDIGRLQADFDKYINKHGMVTASLLAAYADNSIKNLSSIICLAEANEKRILLTGDARGDRILAGLAQSGLLNGGPLEINILKVPHHGSDRNLTKDFFEQIIADVYVLSGNGKHGNPERETLEWLTEARGKDAKYEIVLTYSVAEIDRIRKLEAKKKNKSWSKSVNSLEAFFDSRMQEGYKFNLQQGGPYKINLGDEKLPW